MRVSRTLALVGAVTVVAVPAVVLRAVCAGRSCDAPAGAETRVPFCSLPDELRTSVANGFREGRSPDVLVATGGRPVAGGSAFASGELAPVWPSTATTTPPSVPLAFWGAGIDEDAEVPAGTGLEDVAPTLADVMALRRPHPEVRSGRPVASVADGTRPRLVVEIALAGVGRAELDGDPKRWRFVRRMLARGASTAVEVGSLPLDPAAVLTTIGTAGPPAQHGIPGSFLRDDEGDLARAWGPGAPPSVIATLGDDLDEVLRQRPRIGLVAPDRAHRGLIGGNWYVRVDRDDVVVGASDPARATAALLTRGYSADRVPDLLGVVLDGLDPSADDDARAVVTAAERIARGETAYVLTATGSAHGGRGAVDARRVARYVERAVGAAVVEATAPGGLFLRQRTLAQRGISEDEVIESLSTMNLAGERVFADAFPAIAVSFERYC